MAFWTSVITLTLMPFSGMRVISWGVNGGSRDNNDVGNLLLVLPREARLTRHFEAAMKIPFCVSASSSSFKISSVAATSLSGMLALNLAVLSRGIAQIRWPHFCEMHDRKRAIHRLPAR